MSMVDRLPSGVTTVTLNARYYALHGLVADAARRCGAGGKKLTAPVDDGAAGR